MNQIVILFQKAYLRLQGKIILKNISWTVRKGENWAIVGLNGAGKSTLVKSIFDNPPINKGNKTCIYNLKEIGYVAFDLEKIFHSSPPQSINATKLHFKISRILDLSTASRGEIKKFLIARALAKKPKLLILDEPFDGLDEGSRVEFRKIIAKLLKKIQLIIISHRPDEIPKEINRVLVMHNGKVFTKGVKKSVLNQANVKELFSHEKDIAYKMNLKKNISKKIPDIFIEMKNVTVRYGKKIILKSINWTMRRGENWAIFGPNGAGKTTFLKLITGDNQQSYGQDIKIFGIQKGTGESLWEIKKYISEISGDLQLRYQKNITSLEVVISGLFDSIGLYQKVSKKQINTAKMWLKNLDLEKIADQKFNHLSQGQQRMLIIARAMMKSPLLLILDEPTHGLDIRNKKKLSDIIDWIGENTHTQILYVTHHKNEIPKIINKTLYL